MSAADILRPVLYFANLFSVRYPTRKRYPINAARSIGAPRPDGGPVDHYHAGVDIGPRSNAAGLAVLSPVTGRVIHVGAWDGKDNLQVQIKSPVYGVVVLGGVGNVLVREGDTVLAGEHIASIDDYSGGSAMIHMEWWFGGQRPGPSSWREKDKRPRGNRNPLVLLALAP
jgi:murein DD-endopeptidase MepM/ murein hydrolase activator NlpD